MKISTKHTYASVIRRFTISSDHPVVAMAYASSPKLVRITAGSIIYKWKDGKWTVRSSWDIKISGPVLKKDGTDSKNHHERRPEDIWSNPDGLQLTEEYAWLQSLIDLLRPSGSIAMTVLDEHEAGTPPLNLN